MDKEGIDLEKLRREEWKYLKYIVRNPQSIIKCFKVLWGDNNAGFTHSTHETPSNNLTFT